jgi:hypothetical protein
MRFAWARDKAYSLRMDEIPRSGDLTTGEMATLKDIIARSFVTTGTVPKLRRERLLDMGLVSAGMGGLMPTPKGRIVARSLP